MLKSLFENVKDQAIRDYCTFLKFKSISTDPSYAKDVQACANWLADYLREMGLKVEIWPTKGYPTIFASYEADPQKPTLMIYNHYDVQPIDPVNEWISPPFEPTIRDNEVFARGAQDNKGQCFYTIQALKALLKRDGKLPINIKLCIEGEEECGSAGLSGILESKAKELQADYLAIIDVGLRKKNEPSITLGTRGLVTMEVEITGSSTDLHSGSHGGLAYNPNHALVQILGSLRNSDGKIAIPGFYEDVQPLSSNERKLLEVSFDENEYEKVFGCKPSGGEKEFSPLERASVRPTLEINGISGGYAGVGFKTVIPAKAYAKISCRLVPNQDPEKIGKLVSKYIEDHAPKGVKVKVTVHKGVGKAVRANPTSPIVKAFLDAYSEIFHKPCKIIYEGASIPVVPKLAQVSNSDVVLVGLGLPDDQIHAPNEHFGVDRFEQGFLTVIRAIEILGGK